MDRIGKAQFGHDVSARNGGGGRNDSSSCMWTVDEIQTQAAHGNDILATAAVRVSGTRQRIGVYHRKLPFFCIDHTFITPVHLGQRQRQPRQQQQARACITTTAARDPPSHPITPLQSRARRRTPGPSAVCVAQLSLALLSARASTRRCPSCAAARLRRRPVVISLVALCLRSRGHQGRSPPGYQASLGQGSRRQRTPAALHRRRQPARRLHLSHGSSRRCCEHHHPSLSGWSRSPQHKRLPLFSR